MIRMVAAMKPATDPTPFRTRTRLLTQYGREVQEVIDGKDPYPVAIEVNLSSVCGQNCRWCISGNVRTHQPHEGAFLKLDAPGVRAFFCDFKRLGGQALGWSGGGEPTRHPNFVGALRMVNDIGIPQGVMTHGAFDHDYVEPISQMCAWVRVSIDTHDPDKYHDRRRPTDGDAFERVLANVRALAKSDVYIGLNINVAEWNKADIEPLYDLACKLGARYLQVRPVLPTPFKSENHDNQLNPASSTKILKGLRALKARECPGTELIVSSDKFGDVHKPNGGRTYRGCAAHQLFMVLNSDGKLHVCMYHLNDNKFVLGNIYDQTLEQIWQSEKRRDVVSFCADGLSHKEDGCQVCCKGHEINKVLLKKVSTASIESMGDSPFI